MLEVRILNFKRGLDPVKGLSQTMLTWFCPLLTTYLHPVDICDRMNSFTVI